MLVKELIERQSRFVKTAWIRLIEKKNLESAAAIHATSDLEEQELRRFGWQLPPITTIPNGIEEIKCFAGSEVSTDVKQITAEQPLILFLVDSVGKRGSIALFKLSLTPIVEN